MKNLNLLVCLKHVSVRHDNKNISEFREQQEI